MEVWLHALGICPDSFAHIDLTDILAMTYHQIVQLTTRK